MNYRMIPCKKHPMLGILLTIIMMLAFLTACSSVEQEAPSVYEVEHNGKTYTVDEENQTIAIDGYVCRFEISNDGSNVNFDVTYPDGSTYWWSEGERGGAGGWSDDYNREKYVSGDVLWEVLNLDAQVDTNQGNGSSKYIILGIFLILVGAVNAAAPRAMWYIGYGWRYKNAEPSDTALLVGRGGGVIAIIIGIICFFL